MEIIKHFYLKKYKMRLIEYNETLDILRNNINDLHIVSNHLFENETMTHEELKSLIRKEMC